MNFIIIVNFNLKIIWLYMNIEGSINPIPSHVDSTLEFDKGKFIAQKNKITEIFASVLPNQSTSEINKFKNNKITDLENKARILNTRLSTRVNEMAQLMKLGSDPGKLKEAEKAISVIKTSLQNNVKEIEDLKKTEKDLYKALDIPLMESELKKLQNKSTFTASELKTIFEIQEIFKHYVSVIKKEGLELRQIEEIFTNLVTPIAEKAGGYLKNYIAQKGSEFQSKMNLLKSQENSPAKFSDVFALEAEIRNLVFFISILNLNLSDKLIVSNANPSLENLTEQVSQLVQETKQSILKSPKHFTTVAAADKGRAAQVGFQTLQALTKQKKLADANVDSAQEVYLSPETGAVLKRGDPVAQEEERNVDSLFSLMTKQGVVSSFHIERGAPSRFGIRSLDQATELQGIALSQIPPGLLNKILERLNPKDKVLWEKYYKNLQADHAGSKSLFFLPNINEVAAKQAYSKCEACKWSYHQDGKTHVVDFRTLHMRHLTKPETMTNITPLKAADIPTAEELQTALDVKWKLAVPDVLRKKLIKGEDSQIEFQPLIQFQSKPFVENMQLLGDIRKTGLTNLNAVTDRLTPDSEFNAILTGELEFMDLHHQNIGLKPQMNEASKKYEGILFKIPSNNTEITFKELMQSYLSGQIKEETILTFEVEGRAVTKSLRDLPELKKALAVQWDLVFFDTNGAIGEDNELMAANIHHKTKYAIPVYSVLMEIPWKDKPLSAECVNKLINSSERDMRVRNWAKNVDAPILQRLTPLAKNRVEALLDPLVQKYSLSKFRHAHKEVTIADLREKFATDLCDIANPENLFVWKELEKELSITTIRREDTLETIAKRYKQNIADLKRLNPIFQNYNPKTALGVTTINIQVDICSKSQAANDKRIEIAKQLFPRLTYRQQTALFERQAKRADYLKNYQGLNYYPKLAAAGLSDKLISYVNTASTPLSSFERMEFLNKIKEAGMSNATHPNSIKFKQDLLNIHAQLQKKCIPTYFNVMKAMYPLLADAHALNLNTAVFGDEQVAGYLIGQFILNDTINSAKANYAEDSLTYQLAVILEKKIANKTDPSFYEF